MREYPLFALLVFVSSVAQAQPASPGQPASAIDDARDGARLHLGPFYLTPALQLKELGVDSNVFNSTGQQLSDFTVVMGPQLKTSVPVAHRALLRITAGADLEWFAQYSSERSIDPQVSVRGEVYLARLTLFAADAYTNTRQRPNYEIDLRSRHQEHDAVAGGELRLTRKLSIQAAGVRELTRYDADAFFDGNNLQQMLNRETTGFRVVASHRITPLTTVVLRSDRLQDRFVYTPSRDSNSYRVLPGVEFKPRALVKGSAYVGYRKFAPAQPAVLPSFEGLVAQLGLSYTLSGSTTFGVTYLRDLTYSYEARQPFFVDSSAGLSIRRALGRHFDLLVSTDRHLYDYRDLLGASTSAPTPPREDITWTHAGSIGYRLRSGDRIGFGVSYWKRESATLAFKDFGNLRVGSTMSHDF
jgi:putative beta-barrel porin BBP2